MAGTKHIYFGDSGEYVMGNGSHLSVVSSDDLNLTAGGNLQVTAGLSNFSGNATFIGTVTAKDLTISDTSNPIIKSVDSDNNITTELYSNSASGYLGTSTNHTLQFFTNNVNVLTLGTDKSATFGGNVTINKAVGGTDLRLSADNYSSYGYGEIGIDSGSLHLRTGTGGTNRLSISHSTGNAIFTGKVTAGGTDGIVIPSGTTAQRGTTTGTIRYNTSTSKFEGYTGSFWRTLDYSQSPDSIAGMLAWWDVSDSNNVNSSVVSDLSGNGNTAIIATSGSSNTGNSAYYSSGSAVAGKHPAHNFIQTANSQGVLVFNHGNSVKADFNFGDKAWTLFIVGEALYNQASSGSTPHSSMACPSWATIYSSYSSNYHIIRGNECGEAGGAGVISLYAPGSGESGSSVGNWTSSAGTHHTADKWHLWVFRYTGYGETMKMSIITNSGINTITLNANTYWYWGTGPLHMGNSQWSPNNEGMASNLISAGWYNRSLSDNEVTSIQDYYKGNGYDI